MNSLFSQCEVQCRRSVLTLAASAKPVTTAIVGAGHPMVSDC
ncbi:MAG: hypothetical protein QF598_09480 [Arenicellales bacterium]|nr:hypothetical protein [Arenicellales bacterium]MDP6948784.1 hypothetical protein [Arenicellales bacterium]